MKNFEDSFQYKLIYVFEIRDDAHKGLLKIGDATVKTDEKIENLLPNCKILNQAAKERIKQYTNTAGIEFHLLHTELALYKVNGNLKTFRDYNVHRVLLNSNIEKKAPNGTQGKEWFKVNLETVKQAINAVKQGINNLSGVSLESEEFIPITLRPEQEDAVNFTVDKFNSESKILWNAKMRFGKTLSALEVVCRIGFSKTIIITHRPVVDVGWYDDFKKIFQGNSEYLYGSKNTGYKQIDELLNSGKKFIYFASMQDLRGSETVGGKFSKNENIFKTDWDLVIVDEAHEGTTTALGDSVIKNIVKENSKFLALSGTPFNILGNYEENIYTWDYIMEQRRKIEWDIKNFGDSNPYADLPKMNIYTYNLGELLKNSAYIELEDKAFNFREFFRTKEDGNFFHEQDIKSFLDLLIKPGNDNYPYSKEEYRKLFRHSLWNIPGVREGRALSKLLKLHRVFKNFEIVNVAGDGDENEESADALEKVRKAIDNNDYTITLSCGKLTTGVTVPEWTAVFMLAGSFSTSAASYLQTIFRVQSPYKFGGKFKQNCYVFDFAPDRTLKVIAESAAISAKAGKTDDNDRQILGEFLNFCPIIAIKGSQMQEYDTNRLLQQLKRAYAERAAQNGFDDTILYNDELLRLDDLDIEKFNNLKGIVGASKAQKKTKEIDINAQGFTDEEYEKIKIATRKPKRELTDEEKSLLEEARKKSKLKADAISILRGLSIRMPLLIYGANVPVDEDFKIEMLLDIDDASWEEFMPKGVTKEIFDDFIKYYDPEIFVGAGHRIRNLARGADELPPTERVKKIADLFATFKNPDKETVLTPFRVVNIHMGDCLGGWDFFDEKHEKILDVPRFIDCGQVTADTLANTQSKILEINSKTGLYPLYVAYSIYRARLGNRDENSLPLCELQKVWDETVSENIFVICKTPMAKAIRTLVGFRNVPVNAHYFADLINTLKNESDKFVKRVKNKNTWKKGVGAMDFDAVVGNPPYQEETGGSGRQAKPIYQYFVESAKKISPNYISVIMPSRWFVGGMGLEDFRNSMMHDKHIKKLVDYVNAKDCFPTSSISGGVCFFLIDKNYKGDCKFKNVKNGEIDEMIRPLDEFSILVRYNKAISIIRKVTGYTKNFLSEIISPISPFGLSTKIRGGEKINVDDVKVFSSETTGYLSRNKIRIGMKYLDKFKVMISQTSAEHAGEPSSDGKFRVLTSSMRILKPDEVCTHSYLVAGIFDSETDANGLLSYLKTKFLRFLVALSVTSIHITTKTFCFVPVQDFSRSWTDEELYLKYGLSDSEIEFID